MTHATTDRLRRALLTVLLLAGLGTASTGCATDQQVIAQANDVHQQLEPSVVTDPVLDRYVQAVGDRIVASARELHAQGELDGAEDWMFQDVQFHMVASPQLNAFTTGGKHIYFYTAMFEASDSEAAFAAVVGHEFGHILGRHVQSSMNRQMATLATAGVAGLAAAALSDGEDRVQTGTTVAGVTAGVGNVFGLGFGRENEREADAIGYDIYVNAGYDPDKFADFFKALIEEGAGGGGGGFAGYLSSHPQLEERVETAERRAQESGPNRPQSVPPIASPSEFEELQELASRYTARAASEADNSAAFAQAQEILDAFPRCVGEEVRRE